MQEKQVVIVNRLGLHARAAAKFVTLASSFSSEVEVSKDGQTVNGKSIMGVMMLAASKDTKLVITTRGNDEDDAASQLEKLIREKFGEAE
jgi:phosphocarrier protein